MKRLLTAIVVLPVLIASIWIPQLELVFVALAVAAVILGLYEFYLLAARRELKPDVRLGMVFAVGILTVFYLGDEMFFMLPAVIAALVITVLAKAALSEKSFESMLGSTAATVLGVLYVALLGGFVLGVRVGFADARAAQLLTFFFLVLMGSDSAAYYTGRAFGKRKLAPRISPGKTWEGAAGGFVASIIAAVIAHFTFFRELPLTLAVPLAATMNVLGVVGDLTESALKRGAGAKDAANILPGHGGLLDRLDSLLFNAPLIYYFARIYF